MDHGLEMVFIIDCYLFHPFIYSSFLCYGAYREKALSFKERDPNTVEWSEIKFIHERSKQITVGFFCFFFLQTLMHDVEKDSTYLLLIAIEYSVYCDFHVSNDISSLK